MFEQRSLKRDIAALALLGAVAFAGVSLATYSAADPPGTVVYPASGTIANACGGLGALAAHWMLTGLGLGAYYVVASAAVLDLLLLRRKPIEEPMLRAIGWAASLVAFTTFAAMAMGRLAPGPVIGPGGYLGAAGRGLLEAHFATAGAYILTGSLLFGGLLLCTDYVLLRISLWLIGKPAKGLMLAGKAAVPKVVPRTGGVRSRGTTPRTDGAADDDLESLAIKHPSRSRGKGKKTATATALSKSAAADRSDLDDEPEFDEEDSAAIAASTTIENAEGEVVDEPDDESDDTDARPLRIRPPVKKKSDQQAVKEQLDAATLPTDALDYELPSVELLREADDFPFESHEEEVRKTAKLLERTFANFGFHVRVVEIQTGPVIAQYEIELERGLRLAKITGLADDIAIALRVPAVRIVAPIPGKNTVGIEVPNSERQIVRLREIVEEATAKSQKHKIPIFLGKDVSGNAMVIDLATLPHLLIAGRTGTGKSVCLNSIIISLLMTRRPDEVRMLLIDPKMVELSPYQKLPHLMHPVVTDMRKAEAILGWAVEKMEERYALLARAGVRHVSSYNQLGEEELMERLQPETDEDRAAIPRQLPFIVIVADEMADLMMTSGKEVEQHIIRLAQKSRAVGIHLILATQKPTVDVITGLIKSNLPARISFQVASRVDSRVVLDEMGAEKLLGNGDMLFLWPGTSCLLRGQGTYVSDEEITRVVGAVSNYAPQFVKELVQLKPKDIAGGASSGRLPKRDELYESAVDLVVREGRGSVSLLQRSLGIGYGRAARLIDFMAEDGIVGEYNGQHAREVLMSIADWEAMQAQAAAEPSPPPRSSSLVVSTTVPAKRSTTKHNAIVLRQDAGEVEDDDDSDPDDSDEEDVVDADSDDDELDDDESDVIDADESPEDEPPPTISRHRRSRLETA